MSDIKLKYFGTDGVRGIANESLTPELAFRLGRTGGAILTQHAESHKKPVVIVGRDTRISGEMLQQAIVAGFLSVGIDVLSLGVITTPAVAFLVQNLEADAGVQITASHNPAADNGIKFLVMMVLSYQTNWNMRLSSYWMHQQIHCQDLALKELVSLIIILKVLYGI